METRNCRKCGLPLGFKKLENGRWCPINPDGSDHWDLCRDTQYKNMSQRERDAYRARQASMMAPRKTNGRNLTHVYANEAVPPWDESLGMFRDFTDAEMLAGIVCEAVK